MAASAPPSGPCRRAIARAHIAQGSQLDGKRYTNTPSEKHVCRRQTQGRQPHTYGASWSQPGLSLSPLPDGHPRNAQSRPLSTSPREALPLNGTSGTPYCAQLCGSSSLSIAPIRRRLSAICRSRAGQRCRPACVYFHRGWCKPCQLWPELTDFGQSWPNLGQSWRLGQVLSKFSEIGRKWAELWPKFGWCWPMFV